METTPESRVNDASLPGPVKDALLAFVRTADAFIPLEHHSFGRQFYFRRIVDGVVDEALNAGAPLHWWESDVFYYARATGETELPAARAARAACAALIPALRAHLGPYDRITLAPITSDTIHPVARLSDTLDPAWRAANGDNVYALAEALFEPTAWPRAILAGKAPIGFVMLRPDRPKPGEVECARLMIAQPFHGYGYATPVVEALLAHVRGLPGVTRFWGRHALGEGRAIERWFSVAPSSGAAAIVEGQAEPIVAAATRRGPRSLAGEWKPWD